MGRTERKGQIGSLRIAGRYRLVEKLGTGGMSEVWRGYDETLGRSVAVKVLSPRLAGDQSFRDRMRQEALAAARLCHPHITGIFDFGESPLDEGLTVPYVVMELNDGESVSARIRRQGPLPWRDAVTVAVEVASALATAHARGVVHRDITPANVMLTGGGAKVVDFGISAIVGQRDAAPDGSLLGTPAYLAPERLGGAQVSAATDVYALGLLLYRSLCGRHPWPADNTTEALRAHLYADPDPLPAIPGLPEAVAELCLRCLAKDPADRPGAARVAHDLAVTVGVQPIIPPLVERADDAPEAVCGAAPPPAVVPRRRPGLARSLLAYLGLPGGVPGPRPAAQVLRLRVGMKVGAALRVGGARSLGGGLFASGRTLGRRMANTRIIGGPAAGPRTSDAQATSTRTSDTQTTSMRTSDARMSSTPIGGAGVSSARTSGAGMSSTRTSGTGMSSTRTSGTGMSSTRPSGARNGDARIHGARVNRGRHRVQAAMVTVAVMAVAVAGAGWATSRDVPPVREAQAAGAAKGTVAAAGREDGSQCAVRYQLRRDTGRSFEAQLTVAITKERGPWRVQFSYPGSQQLTGTSRAVTQKGRKVTAKGHGTLKSFTLRGRYTDYNPLPLVFAVDGVECRAEVMAGVPASRYQRPSGSGTETPPSGTAQASEHPETRRRSGPGPGLAMERREG